MAVITMTEEELEELIRKSVESALEELVPDLEQQLRYRYSRAAYARVYRSQPHVKEAERARALRDYHRNMQDPEFREKKRELARRSRDRAIALDPEYAEKKRQSAKESYYRLKADPTDRRRAPRKSYEEKVTG